METFAKLSDRGRFVRTLLTVAAVVLAIFAYYCAIYFFYRNTYISPAYILNRDFYITSIFIAIYWIILEFWLNLNEVYRSRSYGYIALFHFVESVLGTVFLTFTIIILGLPNFGRDVILLFGALSFIFCLSAKIIFYFLLRRYRRRGNNLKTVVIICDKTGERLINLLLTKFEWGYHVKCLIGDSYIMDHFQNTLPVYLNDGPILDEQLTQDVDELIYARDFDSSYEITSLIDLCTDLGITFRLYSSFFNRISSNTQLRYFDTYAVITISNTPTNYIGLLAKRIFDFVFSLCVMVIGLPIWILVAVLIKIDSKGPIFFKQRRSGLKGKIFSVYKFRTMCDGAEKMRDELESENEMTGPVFKIKDDPRVTRLGRILRKSGIDEIPQFFNVFRGDMSVVGPRPPIPTEVEKYERWQLRRLAMRPGITCLWQVARNRNEISFEEWMRMDMNYIDNWSFSLDIVIILKTIRTIFRGDGR